ncbi:MAG: hypothetical protein WD897_01000 [Parcubacteria group bacterium]
MIFKNSKLLLITLSFISVILLTILILGAYNIQLKNKEASELLNLADESAEARTLAQSIRTTQENAVEDLTAFDSLVLSGDRLVPLIDNIERAGRTFGLDTNIVSVAKIEDKESIEPDMIQVVMETQGSWAPTLSFLRAIESLPHRVMIEESSLSRVEVGWRSRIVLSLYSFD